MSESAQPQALSVEERIRSITEEVIEDSALYVVEVQVRGKKGSQVVEIYLDSDKALGVEELARVSREVGFLLDTEDVMPGRYSLNVSSPGAQRPLVNPRQYPKHVGRRLRVSHGPGGGEDVETLEGVLTAVQSEGIVVQVASSNEVVVPFGDIQSAQVLLPW